MILPIVSYGHPILRKKTTTIDSDYPNLSQLIENMYQTMENASGVGLAAPQVGLPIRLFVVDSSPFVDNESLDKKDIKPFREAFINPQIIEESGKVWNYSEGCLSIPGIYEDVSRNSKIVISYQDEHFISKKLTIEGILARVVQHEYDHLEGVLFTDKISSFKRKLLRSKMLKISKGQVEVNYNMNFFNSKKR